MATKKLRSDNRISELLEEFGVVGSIDTRCYRGLSRGYCLAMLIGQDGAIRHTEYFPLADRRPDC